MAIPTYLKAKQKRAFSKYHRLHEEISSTYGLIRHHFFNRFYGFNKYHYTKIERTTLDFVAKHELLSISTEGLDAQRKDRFKTLVLISALKTYFGSYSEPVNWTRGRISGKVISIVVKDGQIAEKIYLTSKGNKVSVKRNQLGLLSTLAFHL